MDGPDLSHLLDDASSEKPSRDVLDGIVRRRRRLQARRARTAATLGLVILLAGAGVGIGLSRQGGRTMSALPLQTAKLPSMSRNTSAAVPFLAGPGSAPAGLGWVSAGSGAEYSANVVSPSARGLLKVRRTQASCKRRALSRVRARRCAACGIARCTRPMGRLAALCSTINSLARAVASLCALSPLSGPWRPSSSSRLHRVPPPRLPWSPWRPALNRAPRFPRFPAGAAGELCRDPGPCCRGV